MSVLRSALLYASIVLGANAAFTIGGANVALAETDVAALAEMREGEMKKLVFHATPKPAGTAPFSATDGSDHTLDEFRGKITVLNFWAVWCAPCRKEMPSLDALAQALGGENFMVLPIATGRNKLPAIEKLFAETGVTALPIYTDQSQTLSRQMGVLGLPVTVILNRDGAEIARLTGDANWNSDSAKAILRALIEG
ncbi:TlpA disulfide reductase family protein [Aliiroseovarius crassostreae]|uniref:TlpA family protein disulfide reductase n=1 Tax=Aliiroseovarius crassostreae TaxID=154981 RepID=UPI00220E6F5F|nr:TlpA disulfide reductase family protein [Aliiroseovarius crassostreae]UWQ04296.1 TlpA family protein disulfide reductase [Aliiroseovarius crassostreae]